MKAAARGAAKTELTRPKVPGMKLAAVVATSATPESGGNARDENGAHGLSEVPHRVSSREATTRLTRVARSHMAALASGAMRTSTSTSSRRPCCWAGVISLTIGAVSVSLICFKVARNDSASGPATMIITVSRRPATNAAQSTRRPSGYHSVPPSLASPSAAA